MDQAEPVLRPAAAADIPAILALLADDGIGRTRESAEPGVYLAALAEIERDPNNAVYVIDVAGEVAGCAQLTIIPGLSRGGMRRALVEAVRVSSSRQGAGLGRWLMDELVRMARERGCGLVQLTSDKTRADAHRFYEGLGFEPSHVGYKLRLA